MFQAWKSNFEWHTRIALGILLALATIEPATAARKAFVVGISDYDEDEFKLKNPAADAMAIRDKLIGFGFNVSFVPQTKTKLTQLKDAWGTFIRSLRRNDEVVVYYSGHGISINSVAYFAAKDFKLSLISENKPIDQAFLPLSKLLQEVTQTFPNSVVWIFDACRDNKLDITGKQRGLSYYKFGVNNAALYSAAEGEESFDRYPPESESGQHSVFTKELLDVLEKNKNADIYYVASQVNKRVAAFTSRKQNPGSYLNMNVDWCFGKCETEVTNVAFENQARMVIAENTAKLSATKSVVRRSIARNAIFLGRKSAVPSCDEQQGYLHPFGCELLKDLARGSARRWISAPLKATWPAYRRYRPPTVVKGRLLKNQLSCKVGSVSQDESVEIAAILSIDYEASTPPGKKDTFYWGLLPESKPCPPLRIEKNLVAKITRIVQP